MKDADAQAAAARRDRILRSLESRIPYIGFLHVEFARSGDELTATMRFADDLIGNPVLKALHGGATGAFMEIAAIVELVAGVSATPESDAPPLPRTVDFTVDYLRSGRPMDAYARAQVLRLGRRIAHVRVDCWQEERARPIAAAHGNFLLPGV